MSFDLVELLTEAQLMTADQSRTVKKQGESSGDPVDGCIVKLGIMQEGDLLSFLSQHFKVPKVDLQSLQLDTNIIDLVPGEIASKFNVVPVGKQGRVLHVAMANPLNIYAVEDIKFLTGYEVQPVVAPEYRIKEAIGNYYDNTAEALENLMKDFEDEDVEVVEADDGSGDAVDGEIDAPVVKLVNSIIAEAVQRRASDIHIEPFEKMLRVRFRIDGRLYEIMHPPVRMRNAITSRLKIMAELDIAERRVPQDGNIKIRVTSRTIDLRVSTLPTVFGEKIVMRILDQSNLNVDLSKLGFSDMAMKNFEAAIRAPWGMVLVTGPTGSGKTTTLYSALSAINTPDTNIMTAEDPVEYNLEGINQVAIHEQSGMTFPKALRAFLRQDPNIVMVGEIRDIDTGSIAIKAALTGHLVLSTLHTNDAPSTINRIIDMGIQPFLVSSSVRLVLAQRLVRKICGNCTEPFKPHPEALAELGVDPSWARDKKLLQGTGCESCNNTGYSGRLGLYEVMHVSAEMSELILDRASVADLRKLARSQGMQTLREDGIWKVGQGITTIAEILKETAAV